MGSKLHLTSCVFMATDVLCSGVFTTHSVWLDYESFDKHERLAQLLQVRMTQEVQLWEYVIVMKVAYIFVIYMYLYGKDDISTI